MSILLQEIKLIEAYEHPLKRTDCHALIKAIVDLKESIQRRLEREHIDLSIVARGPGLRLALVYAQDARLKIVVWMDNCESQKEEHLIQRRQVEASLKKLQAEAVRVLEVTS